MKPILLSFGNTREGTHRDVLAEPSTNKPLDRTICPDCYGAGLQSCPVCHGKPVCPGCRGARQVAKHGDRGVYYDACPDCAIAIAEHDSKSNWTPSAVDDDKEQAAIARYRHASERIEWYEGEEALPWETQ